MHYEKDWPLHPCVIWKEAQWLISHQSAKGGFSLEKL